MEADRLSEGGARADMGRMYSRYPKHSRYPARYPLICSVALLLGTEKNPSKSVFECIIMLVGAILVKMSRNGFIKMYEDKENIVWRWNV